MSLPFVPGGGLIVVPDRLYRGSRDVVVRLALDTGATATVINWDVIVLLGYDPAAVEERIQMTTGSGVEFAPRLRIDRFEALGVNRENYPVLCHTLPPSATVDGLIGLDFLAGKRLTLDFRRGSVNVD